MQLINKNDQKHGIFNKKQIEFLTNYPRYKKGSIQSKLGRINFVDACTLINGHNQIFRDRIYDFKTSSDEPCIIDCGANIGLASIFFKLIYPSAKIVAIEPDPEIFQHLEMNLKGLGISDNVSTINSAAWINSKSIEFDVEGGYSGQIRKYGHQNVINTIRVPAVKLKNIITSFPKIDMLKIDIEGAEIDVLEDSETNLSHVDHIFIEYHSHKDDPQRLGRILNILKENSFRYHIKEAYTTKRPFVDRETLLGMDLQLDIFGYKS